MYAKLIDHYTIDAEPVNNAQIEGVWYSNIAEVAEFQAQLDRYPLLDAPPMPTDDSYSYTLAYVPVLNSIGRVTAIRPEWEAVPAPAYGDTVQLSRDLLVEWLKGEGLFETVSLTLSEDKDVALWFYGACTYVVGSPLASRIQTALNLTDASMARMVYAASAGVK